MGSERRLVPAALLGLAALAAACAPGPRTSPPPAAAEPVIPEAPAIEPGQAPPPGPYAPGLDVLHYDLTLSLPETDTVMRGRARLRILLVDPRPDSLRLDFTGLAVDEVTLDGRPVAARLEAGKLRLPLPGGARVGDTVRVEVRYHGVPDDGLILRRTVHGAPSAFADNWPNRARFWFPGVDHPSDKATVRFVVTAPARWRVVANGALARPPMPSPTGAGGERPATRTWEWETAAPIPTYTMVVGGTEMVARPIGLAACGRAPLSPRDDGCVEVSWWAYPADTAAAARVFRRADRMVDFYTDLVGPFPYEKLANVQSSTIYGGMENASAIFYSEAALAEGRDIEGTVAHEIAHQWFGDSVTESDWHHLWLSEGFATYFGALFFEHAEGVEDFRRRMEGSRRAYIGSDVVDRPIVDPAEEDLFALLNANNYPKGGWVLHMLRGLLGDDPFFRGIRLYYARHAEGTALTADLQDAMEEASGRDLGWFFTQWVHRPGYPVLDLSWEWDSRAGQAHVTVAQTQRESWPVFRLPGTLRVRLEDGETRDVAVELSRRVETLRIPLSGPPAEVVFDPDGWILKEMEG